MALAIAAPALATDTAWKALRFFNLYRTVISGVFVALIVFGNLPPPMGTYDPQLFLLAAAGYLAGAVIAQFVVEGRLLRLENQVLSQLILDVVAITLMLHASGGVSSGFGMLLVVAVAGASILTAGRTGLWYAALAALAVLIEEVYSFFEYALPVAQYTQAGLLGGTFFATALLGHVLAGRLRETEALAAQRELDLQNITRLNELIVQRMRSGVMVVDDAGSVRRANEAAIQLLGVSDSQEIDVATQLPELHGQLQAWRRDGDGQLGIIHSGSGDLDVQVSFARLQPGSQAGTLVFLEDASVIRQRAQQMKLASLGRLTASIAHEVRNPVGAISHASQLLSESAHLAPEDARLSRIIVEHCSRVNTIVENIMGISRRGSPIPEFIDLGKWLDAFVAEFRQRNELRDGEIQLTGSSGLRVQFDVTQLHQVLWNLCANGLRYSNNGNPRVQLLTGRTKDTERPYLDIIDHGTGMDAEVVDHLFEPFFTTEAGGTGLGLYLARELCEMNQSSLHLLHSGATGSRFRITFPHPAKQLLTS